MLEGEIEKVDNMIMRVVEQKNMMEGQRTTVDVVSSMQQSAAIARQNMKVRAVLDVFL
jgi:charged multivesicular body protein 4/18S rRNA (guanine1575-N7)-methyltransferase